MRDNRFCEYSTVYWKINYCIFLLKNPFTLLFKGIASRDSIFIKFDIKTFLCELMFCFKGTVPHDFLLQVFLGIIFPQTSENPQICRLTKFVTFVDLPHVWQFAGFAICRPNIFLDSRICDLLTQTFCGLKTPANLQKNSLFFCLQIHT